MTALLSIWRGRVRPPTEKTVCGIEAAEIASEIAAQYGLTLSDLRSRTRKSDVVWPRQHVMHALHETGRYSTPNIAAFLRLKDHTTILHGIRRHAERAGCSR